MQILPSVGGSTWRLMNYTTILATLMVTPMVVWSGEYADALSSSNFGTTSFWALMTSAGVFGFLINLAYFALIKSGPSREPNNQPRVHRGFACSAGECAQQPARPDTLHKDLLLNRKCCAGTAPR